jgi:hypothetical protein
VPWDFEWPKSLKHADAEPEMAHATEGLNFCREDDWMSIRWISRSLGRSGRLNVTGRIRDLPRLQKQCGKRRWRKLKGLATVRLKDGTVHTAEIHWYEAHGLGKKEFKLKLPLID